MLKKPLGGLNLFAIGELFTLLCMASHLEDRFAE